jgi:hypothetical protein
VRRNPTSPALTLTTLAVFCALAASCARGPSENLLAGKAPARADAVTSAPLLTDGHVATEGADWNAPGAAVLQSENAFVEYDLGRSASIASAFLQGDNNDDYVVSISDDGTNYRELWIARPVGAPGLRGRATEGLAARGRWLKLSARGGDHVYSVTELQVWTGALPSMDAQPSSELVTAAVRARFLYLVLAFGVALFATRQGSTGRALALAWLLPVVAAVVLLRSIAIAWPLGARELSAARASAAAIVLLALLRGWERVRRAPAHHKTVVATCATGAALAFACFYNLGHPQFWNHGKQRPMFVHVVDMRIYQPFTKYFDELGYENIYLASALAFAEDERGGSIDSIAATRIRDLHDFRLRPIGDLKEDMLRVKKRFTPERWAELKQDLTFFRSAIGPGFITSLDDHGANAPPAWVGLARLAIGHVPATEATMTIGGLIDAVLLLAMAWALARSFGLIPMLVAMTVFGATDLYMFGTNWAGATLRHDWLVLLGFAACALRKQRWLLGGALLGAGTMLRVVPAVGLIGVAAPAVAWLLAQFLHRQRPSLRALLTEHRAAARVAVAAAVTMFAIFVITGVLYSFGSWGDWWVRIKALNADLATNEVDLRMLVGGVDQGAVELLRARRLPFVLAQIASVVVVLLAARKRPLDEAMLLGLPLALTLMNSLNYHDHFIFLLVLLGARRGLLGFAAPLLLMCVAGYWVDLDPDYTRHFEVLTAIVFVTVAWIYFEVMRPPLAPMTAPASPPPPTLG